MSWFSPLPHFDAFSVADTSAAGAVGALPARRGGSGGGVFAALIALVSPQWRADEGAAAAPPGVVQHIHLALEPTDVVGVRLPRVLVVNFCDGD